MNGPGVPLSQRSVVDYRRYMAPLAPVQHTRTGRRGHGPSGALAQGAEPDARLTSTTVEPLGAPSRRALSTPARVCSSSSSPPSQVGRWCRG